MQKTNRTHTKGGFVILPVRPVRLCLWYANFLTPKSVNGECRGAIMLDRISYAFGTYTGSDHLHILAYTLYHPVRPVCTTRKAPCTLKVRATVKDVDCLRCLQTETYRKLVIEYEERAKPTYLEQRLTELGSKQVSFFPENAPAQKRIRTPRLVFDADKEMRCAFCTVVVRLDAIKAKYKKRLTEFVERYGARCNRDLAVLCSMGPDDLNEPVLDLEANGLIGTYDFVCFDAAREVLRNELVKEVGIKARAYVNFPISWLKGYVKNGGVMVYSVDSE